MKVSFLQPEGTFSHEFALQEFGGEITCLPQPNFEKVVQAVADGHAEAGVIPFLNSSGVTVEKAHAALHNYLSKVIVSKCAPLHVTHHVAVADGFQQLKRLVSKKEVFPQITTWLAQWATQPEQVEAASTATALQDLIASPPEDKKVTGVVCNELAIALYGGTIAHHRVQNPSNITLFLVIEPRREIIAGQPFLVALEPTSQANYRQIIGKFSAHRFPLMFTSIWGDHSSDRPLFLEFKGPISPQTLQEIIKDTSAQIVGGYSATDSLASCVAQFFE